MRLDILALGSHGDVQPYVALGLGLRAAGHHVRLVTLGGFESFVRGHGLDHVAVAGTRQEIVSTADGQDWLRRRAGVVGFLRGFVRLARALVEDGLARYWRAGQDVEVIVASARISCPRLTRC